MAADRQCRRCAGVAESVIALFCESSSWDENMMMIMTITMTVMEA